MYAYNNIGLGLPPSCGAYEIKFKLATKSWVIYWAGKRMTAWRAFMQQQFEEMAKEQAKQNEILRGLLRQLVKEEDVVIINKLIDPEPMQRWLAVLVADRKRLQVQEKLIDLLDDPHPAVRDSAHHALVRLGRSTDFGPPAKAKAKEIASAQKSWREWHQLQIDTRFADDEAPRVTNQK